MTSATSNFAKFICMMHSVTINTIRLASSGYITAPLPHIKSEHFQYKKYRLNNNGSGGQMNDNFTTIMSEEKYKCSCNATFAYLTRATDNNVTTRINDSAFATVHS
ncbi:hypothetical protein LXA43DRAFT_1067441 [Ganoderma leucocontextum]|nr:hypothetical protein LXA43DRAFT_1067441 [Ganoderma leucocontextum]